jgi:hypothetical protein
MSDTLGAPEARRWTRTGVLVVGLAAVGCADEGATLQVGPVEFTGPAGSLAPHLAVDGDRVLLSWLEPAGEERDALQVAVRDAAGDWSPPRTVVTSDSLFVNWADVPSVTPLADGTWIAHWLRKVARGTYAYHVAMAVSTDDGTSWGPRFRPHMDSSETEHGFVSLVRWNDGAAGLWLDGRRTTNDGPMTLRFTTIATSGAAAADVEVDAQVCDCCQTALARTARGLVAAYRDRAEGEIRDIVVRRFADGAWSDAAKVWDDGWHYPGCPVNGPAIAARGDTVVVAWFTAADETPSVYAAFSTDGGATFAPRRRVDDGRTAGRVDAVWWGEGVLVSWIEETAESGDLRVRLVRPDGTRTGSTIVAVTGAARAVGFPRLAVVGDAVVVAWTQPGDQGGVRAVTLAGGS